MTQLSKIDHYKQRMAANGISPGTAFPPAWRVLWRLGVEVPPPPFVGFVPLALITGVVFGVLFGLAIWLFAVTGIIETSPASIPARAGLAAALFGLFMAAYYRRLARKHSLGSWEAFSGAGDRT
jgi:hypothetical protein